MLNNAKILKVQGWSLCTHAAWDYFYEERPVCSETASMLNHATIQTSQAWPVCTHVDSNLYMEKGQCVLRLHQC